jgi:hypothetical protein
VPHRAGAAAIGVGLIASAVTVPAVGMANAFGADSAEAEAVAFAQLQLISASPTSVTRADSGVVVSRSRSRESIEDIDEPEAAVVAPSAVIPTEAPAAPSPAPAPAPAAPAAPAPPKTVSTSAFDAAAARIGLRGYARVVYSAVRSTFGITNIGGYRAGDPRDHGTGHAVDVMITNRATGDAVAAYVIAHASEFHVKYIIWRQRIWFPGGSWKAMADRGGVTANHYDHVHISVTS